MSGVMSGKVIIDYASLITHHALRITDHFFISLSGDPVQLCLQVTSPGFHLRLGRITRHPDRFAPVEQTTAERVRDQEPIPAREEFFFEQLKVNGTMGSPVALAS